MGSDLYARRVLEHARAPHHRGAIEGPTHAAEAADAACGDRVRVELRLADGRIEAYGHVGEACAVAVASASMLGDLVVGADARAIAPLQARFAAFIAGEGGSDGLGELDAFEPLRRHPSRRQCALLPWDALHMALAGGTHATTVGEHLDMQMTREPAFRTAAADDVDAIVALVESAYRGDASRAGWTTEADMLDGQRTDPAGVAALIGKPDSRILLLEDAGGLLACAHIEKQGGAAYFGMFAVDPRRQGRGTGRIVLAEAERIAHAEWGCTAMQMTVISIRDELIAWYERRGYRRTGEYLPFPYGDARFGIPRRDDLRFERLVKPLA